MEVSLWDVERTFVAGNPESQMNGKRKKELEEGETWRAKNVSLLSSNYFDQYRNIEYKEVYHV